MNILKKENRIVLITGIICVLIAVLAINYTYSFFAVEKTNNSVITGEVESMKLSVTVNRVAPTDDSKLIPQQEAVIESAVTGTTANCVDGNGNTICHVYKVTLKNEGSSSALVSGTLVLDNKSNPNLKWAQISGLTNPTLIGNKNLPSATTFVTNDEYQAGVSKDYYVVVWINETGSSQTDTGNYTGTITFTTVDGNSVGATAESTLTNLGLAVTEATPNFNNTSCSSGCGDTAVGLFESEDDLGTSYYFRGNVTNNYVKFGKNASSEDMYWRIIRINGDGTVRMIYMGTDINATSLNPVGTSSFNISSYGNTYIGYMYGATGQNTYALTHTNATNSTIKAFLEGTSDNNYENGWYYENIVATGYSDYVADTIYCNDRSLSSGNGTLTNTTYYGTYGRLNTDTVLPTLKCDLADYTNDSFTQGTELGNGLLEYPVGLITADELAMAGASYNSTNSNFYLYSTSNYWTMSPAGHFNYYAMGLGFFMSRIGYSNVDGGVGVLPVISLKSNAIIEGSGSTGDPFVVE